MKLKKFNHSLIIGKFYPPHLGHHHLINEAVKQSKTVTVLVMGTLFDTISPQERVDLIKRVHSGANIDVRPVIDHSYDDYKSQAIWKVHMAVIQQNVDDDVDALFTSEVYGDKLAELLGAKHVCVDPSRKKHPVSGTAVRRHLYGQWRHLHPEVQNFFKLNIVVLGGESTGTTTLANELQEHFGNWGGIFADTPCVPEYGREYAEKRIITEGRELVWTKDDFRHIARVQNSIQDRAFKDSTSPILINDTDSVATQAFSQYYGVEKCTYGSHAMRPDLYLVTDHTDMPLVDDGSRLQDIKARNDTTQHFIETIHDKWNGEVPFALMTGHPTVRLETAIRIIRRIMEKQSFFTDPI